MLFGFSGILFSNPLDLTTEGSSGFINSAFFEQGGELPAGCGDVHPFLSIQHKDFEKGYNTDAEIESGYDMKRAGNPNSSAGFTRSLLLSEIPVVSLDGIFYRQFILDINESRSGGLLSLDALQIYLSDSPTLSGFGSGQYGSAVYNMGADSWIGLDYGLNGGGFGDMLAYIPENLFQSTLADPYVYLYSEFGGQAGYGSSAGFEEWAVFEIQDQTQTGQDAIHAPEPATLLLLGSGIIGITLFVRRKLR